MLSQVYYTTNLPPCISVTSKLQSCVFLSWCMGGSKASDCVTNWLLPGLQMVCNTVMSLIKNSVCPLIDQRPKAVPGHTFNEKKDFYTTKAAEQYAMLILQAPGD